jgi:hypothetical protein
MQKKEKKQENYLLRCPLRREGIAWEKDEQEIVTLQIENKGIANRLAQKVLKKPRISYIHLDRIGSFVWPMLCEGKTIMALGEDVRGRFGEEAEPLYGRLAKYFQILDSYGFITWYQTK